MRQCPVLFRGLPVLALVFLQLSLLSFVHSFSMDRQHRIVLLSSRPHALSNKPWTNLAATVGDDDKVMDAEIVNDESSSIVIPTTMEEKKEIWD